MQERFRGPRKVGRPGAKIRRKTEKKSTMQGQGDGWVAQCCRAVIKEDILVWSKTGERRGEVKHNTR